jgi:hypothetical protein
MNLMARYSLSWLSFDPNIRMDRVDIVSGFEGSLLRLGNFMVRLSEVPGEKVVFGGNFAKLAQ